ncbi:MAG: tRNA preQ1(34) S-adenosylmethionine ribosyltransferase-isomerase QueA [Pseudanabaenaceae cyanobacterium]
MTDAADFDIAAYDYELPPTCIAQVPCEPRDRARLLIVDGLAVDHRSFVDLPAALRPGDLLVFNDTRVVPARLYGRKENGVPVEVLLLEARTPTRWLALVKPGKRLPLHSQIFFADGLTAQVVAIDPETRGRELEFAWPGDRPFPEVLAAQGVMPLPPYLHPPADLDPERYQTVYARQPGAVAAPTAGLHFTESLLAALQTGGIHQAFVTLHVGLGTFRPVETADIRQHVMHAEWCEVPAETAAAIRRTREQGGRIVGVGTTVARTLEATQGQPFQGKTDLMIYPGYTWQVLDGLITNFHLPKSTLLMLVASFLGPQGRPRLLDLYQLAIAQGYRFYSFGDGMLLWGGRNLC